MSARDRALAERDAAVDAAQRIVEAARREADACLADARAEAARTLASAAAALADARAASERLRTDELVDLSLAIAEKLLAVVSTRDAEYVTACARDAIARLDRDARVELLAHPGDVAALAAAFPGCTVLGRGDLEPGDLVARTAGATLDARRSVRLEAVASALRAGDSR